MACQASAGVMGSSPRVRGKEMADLIDEEGMGIIPAGAGKRPSHRPRAWDDRDHPRGCGEKPRPSAPLWMGEGSSPRVRGKVRILRGGKIGVGIIPAGAGKSAAGRRGHPPHKDHPRGCGEKEEHLDASAGDGGSSPRVRGKG